MGSKAIGVDSLDSILSETYKSPLINFRDEWHLSTEGRFDTKLYTKCYNARVLLTSFVTKCLIYKALKMTSKDDLLKRGS